MNYLPSLAQLIQFKRYPSEELALEIIWTNIQPNKCPKCHKEAKYYKVSDRKCYCCQWCRNQLYPTANTIFEKTTTSLVTWFYMIDELYITQGQVSAQALATKYNVSYKSGWRMRKLICKELGLPANFYRAKYGPLTYRDLGVSTKKAREKALNT